MLLKKKSIERLKFGQKRKPFPISFLFTKDLHLSKSAQPKISNFTLEKISKITIMVIQNITLEKV
jgi:hypothetical protein